MKWLPRAGLVLFGLVITIALLEAGLQVASLFARSSVHAPLAAPLGSEQIRVLCLGDSNTYGLHLTRAEAYPSQLEVLWNERVETPKLQAVNLGYPGANSTRVLTQLDELLDTFAPDLILLMVGVNDFWTRPLEIGGGGGPAFWKHSRLYRLYLTLQRVPDVPEIGHLIKSRHGRGGEENRMWIGDREFDIGVEWRDDDGSLRKEASNGLHTLVARIADRGIPLHLMTYPAGANLYQYANPLIREVATKSNVSLIDLAAAFEVRCPAAHCPELLFPDDHPTEAGYRVVAETILDHLAEE